MLWIRFALKQAAGRKIPTAYRIATVCQPEDTVRRNGGDSMVTQLRNFGLGFGERGFCFFVR